jgi:hypothetical protein
MDLNYCCADLERLAHPREPGLGLLILIIGRNDPLFLLEYREGWQVPAPKGGIPVKFCPYYGSELAGLLLGQKPS